MDNLIFSLVWFALRPAAHWRIAGQWNRWQYPIASMRDVRILKRSIWGTIRPILNPRLGRLWINGCSWYKNRSNGRKLYGQRIYIKRKSFGQPVSDDEICKLTKDQENVNRKNKTKWAMNLFEKWRNNRRENIDLWDDGVLAWTVRYGGAEAEWNRTSAKIYLPHLVRTFTICER